ncbi:MAG: CPXCG motif-containing cysteine-rich protein [Gammaproteobacteria bacterium]|uniref:CPXCG motif-containing cysteine-rich protein n=1 Tax=Pseudomaricurvus alcaniphilus TaxID=1166482 RepID=UPI0014085194|nr:CPXCG motif-containing cysteine-rich protein [Pseudomaricurvus alcaniphilus]MBR9912461.1 CPXCG motif-containing cysteine-rich protein [Gammaproteobacteria bacterium]NHN37403.1 CPXCG motif-containing cysteine-rich protein [Pseudomaricurvus alcaniphilus]
MNELTSHRIHCPYCGEAITVLVDCSVDEQHYIEDCQVCCRPINFDVSVDPDGDASVVVSHENE